MVLSLIVWKRPNLLLLDEPTNHLDLDMRQTLTEALIEFEGALVVVSHDRDLLRSTTDDLYLVHNGNVTPFDGDLTDYQQWLMGSRDQQNEQQTPEPAVKFVAGRVDQKRHRAELRKQSQPLRNKITLLEQQMEQLSIELQTIEQKLLDQTLYDIARKNELIPRLQKKAQLKMKLEKVEIVWLTMQEQLEILTKVYNPMNFELRPGRGRPISVDKLSDSASPRRQ